MIETQFTGIMQDVTVYYTKKLDMYRIKMEHHQRTRPDRQHYELASILIQAYEEHPNRQVSIQNRYRRKQNFTHPINEILHKLP